MTNRRVSVHHIAATTGISKTSVKRILHDSWTRPRCTRMLGWVPRMLTNEMSKKPIEDFGDNLRLIEKNEEKFYRRIVTRDETWFHHYNPESKKDSMQWKHIGLPTPHKFKVMTSASKIMCTIFWDTESVLLIDYMPPKVTITGPYYAIMLRKLREAIKQNRRHSYFTTMRQLIDQKLNCVLYASAALKNCSTDLLSWLGPHWLLPISKSKNISPGAEISLRLWVHDAAEEWLRGQSANCYLHWPKKLKDP